MYFWERLRWALMLCAIVALPNCGGVTNPSGPSDPAAPPAPPIELPSFLQFPDSLSIELITENDGSGSSGLSTLTQSDVGTGSLRNEIRSGVGIVVETDQFLNLILNPVSRTPIRVDAEEVSFDAVVNVKKDPEDPDILADVHFDFRDFDLDGDGVREGCAGSTCPVAGTLTGCPDEAAIDELQPICFRVWLNGERYMAGRFDVIPTDDNPGSGQFRTAAAPLANALGVGDVSDFGVFYDHSDPDDKLTEMFAAIFADGMQVTDRHVITTEEISGTLATRSANMVTHPTQDSINTLFYLIKFNEDLETGLDNEFDFMGIHLIANGLFGEEGILDFETLDPPICADISEAEEIPLANCQVIGTDVSGIDFVDFPTGDEFVLPPVSTFPSSPPF